MGAERQGNAAQMVAARAPLQYLQYTVLPSDETCYCLFQASSENAVKQANDRAQLLSRSKIGFGW